MTVIYQADIDIARIFFKIKSRKGLRFNCNDRIRRYIGRNTRLICGGWIFLKEACYKFSFIFHTYESVSRFHVWCSER